MITSYGQNGYSADVNMSLLVNGSSLSIAQLGRDFLLLDEGIDHPPGNASIILRVDEDEKTWEVHLPDGLASNNRRVVIALRK